MGYIFKKLSSKKQGRFAPYPVNMKNYETFSDDQERRNLFRQLQNKHHYTIRTDFTITPLDHNDLRTPTGLAERLCTMPRTLWPDDA